MADTPASTSPARARSRRTEWHRKARVVLVLGLAIGLTGVGLSHWGPAESLEDTGLDLLFSILRGEREAPGDVCVVGLDDDSYDELHVDPLKPWPRGKHAELIRELKRQGARAVA